MSLHNLPNAEVIRQCQQERTQPNKDANPQAACLELIRRAFVEWIHEAIQEVDRAYGTLWKAYVLRTPQYVYLQRLEGQDIANDVVQMVYTQLLVKFRDATDFEQKFDNDLGRFKAFFRKSIYNAIISRVRAWNKEIPRIESPRAGSDGGGQTAPIRKVALAAIEELVGTEDSYADLYRGEVIRRARQMIERDDDFLVFVSHFYYAMSDEEIMDEYPSLFKDKMQVRNAHKRVIYRLSTDPLLYDMLQEASESKG